MILLVLGLAFLSTYCSVNRIKYNKESFGGTRKLKKRASRRSMRKSVELLVPEVYSC